MIEKENKFTWGDSVMIKKDAPDEFHPGASAAVCGFYKTQSLKAAEHFACSTEDWIYTVEFEDGSDIEIAECYLEKNERIASGQELSKYSDFFINGMILNIKLDVRVMDIHLKSKPLNHSVAAPFLNSKEGHITGRIVATQIENIILKNSSHSLGWHQEGRILSLEISDHLLRLMIEWDRSITTSLEVISGQIWWECQT